MKTFDNFILRTDLANALLHDINAIPLITAEEEKSLFKKYLLSRDNDEKIKIRNQIIEGNLRLIVSIVKMYDTTEKFAEMFNIACMGALEAFDKYDVNADVRFMTFATHYVRRAINAYYTFDDSMVRPTNCAKILPKVKQIQREFTQEFERNPEPDEILQLLKSKYNIDANYSDIMGAHTEFIEDSMTEDDDYTMEDSSEYNQATSSDNLAVGTMEHEKLSYDITTAMKVLNEKEKTAISMKFGVGYDREYQLDEIAEVMNYTRERIRQLVDRAMKKMLSVMVSKYNL